MSGMMHPATGPATMAASPGPATTTTLQDVIYGAWISPMISLAAIYNEPYSGIGATANTGADVVGAFVIPAKKP